MLCAPWKSLDRPRRPRSPPCFCATAASRQHSPWGHGRPTPPVVQMLRSEIDVVKRCKENQMEWCLSKFIHQRSVWANMNQLSYPRKGPFLCFYFDKCGWFPGWLMIFLCLYSCQHWNSPRIWLDVKPKTLIQPLESENSKKQLLISRNIKSHHISDKIN